MVRKTLIHAPCCAVGSRKLEVGSCALVTCYRCELTSHWLKFRNTLTCNSGSPGAFERLVQRHGGQSGSALPGTRGPRQNCLGFTFFVRLFFGSNSWIVLFSSVLFVGIVFFCFVSYHFCGFLFSRNLRVLWMWRGCLGIPTRCVEGL